MQRLIREVTNSSGIVGRTVDPEGQRQLYSAYWNEDRRYRDREWALLIYFQGVLGALIHFSYKSEILDESLLWTAVLAMLFVVAPMLHLYLLDFTHARLIDVRNWKSEREWRWNLPGARTECWKYGDNFRIHFFLFVSVVTVVAWFGVWTTTRGLPLPWASWAAIGFIWIVIPIATFLVAESREPITVQHFRLLFMVPQRLGTRLATYIRRLHESCILTPAILRLQRIVKWAEIAKPEHRPDIKRIARGGEIALDKDGPLIRKVCMLVASEWSCRQAEATTLGNE